MKRLLIATLGLLLIPQSVFGQTAKIDPQAAKASEEAQKQSPWSASLLLIRADWSKSPDWKEIEADLRQVLSGEPVSKEDLAKLPASWPQILFPVSAASIFSQQHYAQILAWLKAKQLVMQIEPFVSEKVEPAVPGGEQFVNPPSLSKSYEFFGLQTPRAQSDLFFTRTTEFRWTVWEGAVLRELNQYEKGRGQEGIQPVDRKSFDNCNFNFSPLADSQVMIVHGFPDPTGDSEFRQAASAKGFLPLIVVERGPPSAAAATESQVLLPDKVERIKAQRTQGFGSGGRGGGFGVPVTTGRSGGSPSRNIFSKNIMINWSEPRDVAWGFSKSLGKWAKQELNPPAPDAKGIVVDEDLAVWRVGPAYYGFSGEAGRWDVLRLAEGHTPPPVLDNGFARVHDGDDVYTFAGSTGRWSSPKDSTTSEQPAANPDLEIKKREIEEQYKAAQTKLNDIAKQLTNPNLDLSAQEQARLKSEAAQLARQIDSKNRQELGLINEPVAQTSQGAGAARTEGTTETWADGTQLKVFSLRNARAVDAERLVRQLFRREIQSAAADERSNSLIVRGSPGDLNIIYAILTRLDEDFSHQQPPAAGAIRSADGGGLPTAASAANLTKQYETQEQQAAALAHQIRELQSSGKGDKAKLSKLTADLHKVVGESYFARQQLHHAELVQLQQRTNSIRQNLTTRESLKDRIIERRVKDLLDPNLQWENASGATSETKSTAALGQSNAAQASPPKANNELDDVPVNWQSRQEEQIIWNVLGVRVQAITEQSVAKFNYKGGLLVDDIRTAPQPSELRVGDVILGLHIWETKSPNELAWILLQPLSKNVAILNPRDRESEEKAVIYVLRDGQRVHFEIKLPPSMVDLQRTNLPPQPDLGPGTSTAATKGAAQSPASRSQPPLSNSPQPAESKTPGTTSAVVSGKTTLRTPHEFREELIEKQKRLDQWKAENSAKFSGDPEEVKKTIEKGTVQAQSELDFLREEFSAQLRLLRLELDDAQSAVGAAIQIREAALNRARVRPNESTRDQTIAVERALQEAQNRSERAKTLLELYLKADTKNPANEAANPESPAPAPAEPKPQ